MPTLTPHKVFLLDSMGALLSAIFLIVIAKVFNGFGMPQTVLSILIAVAIIYSLYSFCCYRFVTKVWRPFLLAIAVGNSLYSLATFLLLIYYYHQLNWPGVTYFVLELIVLFLVVWIELKTLFAGNN